MPRKAIMVRHALPDGNQVDNGSRSELISLAGRINSLLSQRELGKIFSSNLARARQSASVLVSEGVAGGIDCQNILGDFEPDKVTIELLGQVWALISECEGDVVVVVTHLPILHGLLKFCVDRMGYQCPPKINIEDAKAYMIDFERITISRF